MIIQLLDNSLGDDTFIVNVFDFEELHGLNGTLGGIISFKCNYHESYYLYLRDWLMNYTEEYSRNSVNNSCTKCVATSSVFYSNCRPISITLSRDESLINVKLTYSAKFTSFLSKNDVYKQENKNFLNILNNVIDNLN